MHDNGSRQIEIWRLGFLPPDEQKNLIYVEDAGKIRAVSIYVIRKVPGEQGRIWVLSCFIFYDTKRISSRV